jgi:hypothetical protein
MLFQNFLAVICSDITGGVGWAEKRDGGRGGRGKMGVVKRGVEEISPHRCPQHPPHLAENRVAVKT